MRIKVKCPNCDIVNYEYLSEDDLASEDYRVFFCEGENGGCDEKYVARIPNFIDCGKGFRIIDDE